MPRAKAYQLELSHDAMTAQEASAFRPTGWLDAFPKLVWNQQIDLVPKATALATAAKVLELGIHPPTRTAPKLTTAT